MSAQRELNPHVRHGKATGCRYIMGAEERGQTQEPASDPASLLAGLALLSRLSSLKLLVPNCQRTAPGPNPASYREHQVGLEPTLPHYECGVLAAGRLVRKKREVRMGKSWQSLGSSL